MLIILTAITAYLEKISVYSNSRECTSSLFRINSHYCRNIAMSALL